MKNFKNKIILDKNIDLQSIEKQVKKLITRFKAGLFFLLFIILVTGFFVFAGVNFKMIAQAFINNYDAKQSGDILTAAEWQNLDDDFGSSVPVGGIIMWSGSIASIPSGWALCDGGSGTPDLRDRFVVGAGSSYSPGNTGGVSTVTLTINEMPRHRHSITSVPDNISSGVTSYFYRESGNQYPTVYSNYEGNDGPHENKPPYYALAYIMKL